MKNEKEKWKFLADLDANCYQIVCEMDMNEWMGGV